LVRGGSLSTTITDPFGLGPHATDFGTPGVSSAKIQTASAPLPALNFGDVPVTTGMLSFWYNGDGFEFGTTHIDPVYGDDGQYELFVNVATVNLPNHHGTFPTLNFNVDGHVGYLPDTTYNEFQAFSSTQMPMNDGRWHHVIVAWNASAASIVALLDGQPLSMDTFSHGDLSDAGAKFDGAVYADTSGSVADVMADFGLDLTGAIQDPIFLANFRDARGYAKHIPLNGKLHILSLPPGWNPQIDPQIFLSGGSIDFVLNLVPNHDWTVDSYTDTNPTSTWIIGYGTLSNSEDNPYPPTGP